MRRGGFRGTPLLLVVLLAVLTAVGMFNAGGLGRPGTSGPSVSNGPAVLVTDAVPVPAGVRAEPLPPATRVSLTVVLDPSNASRLAQLDSELIDPSSPEYRHFLTEAQFQADFSPTRASVAAAESYFEGFGGGHFSTTGDRFGVSFVIPVASAERAIAVSFVEYREVGTGVQYTALGTPRLPGSLRPIVAGIAGLSNAGGLHPSIQEVAPLRPVQELHASSNDFVLDGPSGPQWLIGSDYAQSTRTSDLFPTSAAVSNATFPTHEAVATILMSSYNQTTNADLPPWDPAVVNQYFNDTLPASWPHPKLLGVDVPINNVTAPAPGSFNNSNDSTGDEIENSLDLEMAGSMAPGAVVANFYFAAAVYLGTTTGDWGPIADDFAQTLAAALDYSYPNATLVSVTNSYGLPDLNDALWNTELVNAATTGVTVVAASGDQGDAPPSISGRFQGQWPTWPGTSATNDSGTVAVGGASVTLSGAATGTWINNNSTLPDSYDSAVTGIASESPWYIGNGNNVSGTEGGGSVVTPEPSWQRDSAAQPAIVNMTLQQQLTFLPRAEPDVAGPANNTISYVLIYDNSTYFTVLAGTSIASPVVAGMLASEAAVAGHRFGFLDPELYRIGSYFALFGANGDPFQSIPVGHNFLFTAAPGWDPLTGWGTVDAVNFLAADENASISGFQNPTPEPGLPPPSPASSSSPFSGYYVPALLTVGILFTALLVLVIVLSARRHRREPGPGTPPPGAMTYPYGPPGPSSPSSYGYVQPPAPPGGAAAPPLPSSSGSWQWSPGPQPPSVPATFECPYCGFQRPAEAGRCPHCGAF